ncbi:MAG: hypothetical protein J0L73_17845 [Verrucomicrobia bacterium]|nr:hypothetical protein [Verrucomicrobiota bacterium]
MSDFTFTMAPSGQFVSKFGYSAGIANTEPPVIWNPGVFDHLRNSYKIVDYERNLTRLGDTLTGHYQVVNQTDLDSYGEVLAKLAHDVKNNAAHLNLGPLRGAFRPCSIVDVMTRNQAGYQFLNYTRHIDREAEIREDLSQLLVHHDPEEEVFRIQITDTAIGGHGAEHLASMLSLIKADHSRHAHQKWEVIFNLLHDTRQNTNTGKMRAIVGKNTPGLHFKIQLHEVPSLIMEDYDGGLGLKFEGGEVRPCSEPGNFVFISNNGIALVQSEDLKITFDELFTQSVTDGLVTSPAYQQVGDIWNQSSLK